MPSRAILLSLTLLALLQNISKVQYFVFAACTQDLECRRNLSVIVEVICCSGSCKPLSNCPGGCVSDETCSDGLICFLHHCEKRDIDIELPFYCEVNEDCSEGEECESGRCKPSPRPVNDDDSNNLHVKLNLGSSVVVVTAAVFGCLISFAFVGYCSYLGVKRYRSRRFSRGNYTQPSRLQYAVSFSSARNETEEISLYGQPIRERSVIPRRTTYSYPQTPPPEYDSITLDSNFEVELSSPPAYDHDQDVV